jgi:hypothetical protein
MTGMTAGRTAALALKKGLMPCDLPAAQLEAELCKNGFKTCPKDRQEQQKRT